ncbi:hypothetical protein CYMTET_43917 [Cymbomonas tetramitiformis]|uniref:Acyl-CoA dehydrogenase n=1 Tax=Cymbomonas tetramitiformis TaxID=36881 RepID=A0AAE0C3A8_9CHLO|nr:hypothetical protein CYMTET_43917 [Cymbomonas tetramitiformis]
MASQHATAQPFGEGIPYGDPYWYQGMPSPYYKETHFRFRALVRGFVEKEIMPFAEEWGKTRYPPELHEKAYQAGIAGAIFPAEHGGTPPEDFDAFHELILWDELARCGESGVLGQLSINSMAIPPIMHHGSKYLKDKVLRDVIIGKKFCALAISEPTAGSDVANIQCSAKREGDFYIVSGQKKWITGGLMADFFTVACRTGGPGMGGISLLLLEKDMPGISVRKMETQASGAHHTSFVTLDDVKVPAENLIGEENAGFLYIVTNFNHERFVIATGASRYARMCLEESIRHAKTRRTFGKRLVEHQIIRHKIAEMARQVETTHDMLERVAFAFSNKVKDREMGGMAALLKVQASMTFEFCAREASQIFGGSSIVKEGKGRIVERLYREVRATAIPGGSEEILRDLAVRQAKL